MSKFVFDSVVLAGGTLSMTLINNDAYPATTHSVTGDWLISIDEVVESVEENGIGGVIRIGDINLEFLETDLGLGANIFQLNSPTKFYAKLVITVSGTVYTVIYGTVDMSTVTYESIFDDGAGTEYHTVKFTVLSAIHDLTTFSSQAWRGNMAGFDSAGSFSQTAHTIVRASGSFITDGWVIGMFGTITQTGPNNGATFHVIAITDLVITVSETLAVTGAIPTNLDSTNITTYDSGRYYVNLVDALNELQKLISLPVTGFDMFGWSNDLEFKATQFVGFPTDGGGNNFATLALFLSQGARTTFSTLFDNTSAQSYMSYSTCKDVLVAIASQFISYPVVVYNPATDKIHLKLKQRGKGTTRTPANLLLSNRQVFFGYDGFHVVSFDTDLDEMYSPTMTAAQFEILIQKFALQFNLHLLLPQSSGANNLTNTILICKSVTYAAYCWASEIQSTLVGGAPGTYKNMDQFLIAAFTKYWTNADMYERTYAGLNMDIEILDVVVIGGVNYTITEICRNLKENTSVLKMVKYS